MLRRVAILSTFFVALSLLGASIFIFPKLIVPDHSNIALESFTADRRLQLLDARAKLQNDVRTTLLQALGGAVLLIGAYFTWRQLQITREGQVTERFTNAVDQLGHKERDVRVGGIYALGRIAKDSRVDLQPILELISTYIRTRSAWPKTSDGQEPADGTLERPGSDIQAAITVLGRRPNDPPTQRGWSRRLNLTYVDLRGLQLFGANLFGVNLEASSLEDARLIKADLSQSYCPEICLKNAVIDEASFRRAFLQDADLQGVHQETNSYRGPDFRGATLSGAFLHDADLTSARLKGAILDGARANSETRWPAGFDWQSKGIVVEK